MSLTVTCLRLQKNMQHNKNCKKFVVLVTMTATCNNGDGDGDSDGDVQQWQQWQQCWWQQWQWQWQQLPQYCCPSNDKVPPPWSEACWCGGDAHCIVGCTAPWGKGKPPILSLDGWCRQGHWSSGYKDLLLACVARNKQKNLPWQWRQQWQWHWKKRKGAAKVDGCGQSRRRGS